MLRMCVLLNVNDNDDDKVRNDTVCTVCRYGCGSFFEGVDWGVEQARVCICMCYGGMAIV